MSLINKIALAAKNQKSYRVGLLQTKAYRVLKQHTAQALEQYDISTVEWAFLGLLNDQREGLRMNIVAQELGVEAPFVTQMMHKLDKTKYLEYKQDPQDSRAKLIMLTDDGKQFVDSTEKHLRQALKPLLKDIGINGILTYLEVLQKIVDNSKKS